MLRPPQKKLVDRREHEERLRDSPERSEEIIRNRESETMVEILTVVK